MMTLLFSGFLIAAMGACTKATVTGELPNGDGQGESRGDVLGGPGGDSGNGSEGGSDVSDEDSSSETGDTQGDSGEVARVSLENLYILEDTTITCASHNFQKATCKLDKSIKGQIHTVALLDQHSNSSCIEGVSFFAKGRKVVVKEGCRGLFRVEVITNQRIHSAHTRNDWKNIEVQALGFGVVSEDIAVGDTVDLVALENSSVKVTRHRDGVGVEGGEAAVPYQVNHDIVSGESEALVLGLPANAHDFAIHVSRLFKNEGDGENMVIAALDASGNVISVTGMDKIKYKRSKGSKSQHKARFIVKGLASYLVLIPTELSGHRSESSSDFLLERLKFKVLVD